MTSQGRFSGMGSSLAAEAYHARRLVHSALVSDDILVQQDGVVATVVLNRLAMRNAINLAMWTDIARLTEKLSKDDSVWAIVYRGIGTEAFASGADISEF